MTMAAWGLVLNGLGAVIVAYGQWRVSTITTLWLNALEVNVLGIARSLGEGGDIRIVKGVDQHMMRAAITNKWASLSGWTVFVVGIVLQIVAQWPSR